HERRDVGIVVRDLTPAFASAVGGHRDEAHEFARKSLDRPNLHARIFVPQIFMPQIFMRCAAPDLANRFTSTFIRESVRTSIAAAADDEFAAPRDGALVLRVVNWHTGSIGSETDGPQERPPGRADGWSGWTTISSSSVPVRPDAWWRTASPRAGVTASSCWKQVHRIGKPG